MLITTLGLYCALEKPNLGAIIKPLAEEMAILLDGINVYYDENVIQCVPLIMFCACDLQARSPLQNIVSIAGYNGCPVCEYPGESIKNNDTNKKYVHKVFSAKRNRRQCVLMWIVLKSIIKFIRA